MSHGEIWHHGRILLWLVAQPVLRHLQSGIEKDRLPIEQTVCMMCV